MSSLYKKADPVQRRVIWIVEGAVLNAYDAHPDFESIERFARSVAKRAAGTLTSQMDVKLAEIKCLPPDQVG